MRIIPGFIICFFTSLIVNAQKDTVFPFSEGVALKFEQGKGWTYIDTSGNYPFLDYSWEEEQERSVPHFFYKASSYVNGFAIVQEFEQVFDTNTYESEAINEGGQMCYYTHYGHYECDGCACADSLTEKNEFGYSLVFDRDPDSKNWDVHVQNKYMHRILKLKPGEHILEMTNAGFRIQRDHLVYTLNRFLECTENCPDDVIKVRMADDNYSIVYMPVLLDRNKDYLDIRAKRKLDVLAQEMKTSPERKYVIEGLGSSSYFAQQASWEYANAIIIYLKEIKGISREQIIMGYAGNGKLGEVKIRRGEPGENGPPMMPPPLPRMLE